MQWISLEQIARKTGGRSDSKVRQMRRSIKNGAKLPQIRVALIDEMLKKRLGRIGIQTDGKRYFLLEGHHRTVAMELEGKKVIAAKVIRKSY